MPKGLPNGRSLGGGSLDQNPLGRLPPDPLIRFYGRQTFDPRIFMSPWY